MTSSILRLCTRRAWLRNSFKARSYELQPIKQKLVELIALMEAGVDFADDVPALGGVGMIFSMLGRFAPGWMSCCGRSLTASWFMKA